MSNRTFTSYFPSSSFFDKNGSCTLLNAAVSAPAATANTLVITAVTGKRIVVVSYICGAATAADVVATFKSASGGTVKAYINAPSTAKPMEQGILNPAGWIETETGQGLYVDVSAGAAANISLRYYVYTP